MTVSTSTAKSGPYAGSGTTGPFTVAFRFLADSHLRVVRTVVSTGVETDLVLTTDYTVAGAGAASGTVTLVTALAVGETLTILRNVPATQEADYVVGDAFPAESHETALDKLTMLVQQNAEEIGRALRIPASSSTSVSTDLPPPDGNYVFGWNAAGTAIRNVPPSELATLVAYGTAKADIFTGDGTETDFDLQENPASLNNLDVSINGSTLVPGDDYSWTGGTTVTFTTAPPNGSDILIRYMQGLPFGSSDSSDVRYTQGGAGAVPTTVQSVLRYTVSPQNFGAVGNGSGDDTAAFAAALTHLETVGGGVLELVQNCNYALLTWTAFTTTANIQIKGNGAKITGPVSLGTFAKPSNSFVFKNIVFDRWAAVFSREIADGGSIANAWIGNCTFTSVTTPINFECPTDRLNIVGNTITGGTGQVAIRIGTNDKTLETGWKNIRVCNNTITGRSTTGTTGNYPLLLNSEHTIIDGNIIRNIRSVNAECFGIYTKTRFSTISNNVVEYVLSTGSSGDFADCVGITIKGDTRVGVSVSPGGYKNACVGNTIKKIGAQGSHGAGIKSQTEENTITGNIIEDVGLIGIDMNDFGAIGSIASANSIRGFNIIGTYGIWVQGVSDGAVVSENQVIDFKTAIRLDGGANPCTGATVAGNFLRSTIASSIAVRLASGTVRECTFSDNTVDFSGAGSVVVNSDSTNHVNITIQNNNLSIPATAGYSLFSGSLGAGLRVTNNRGYRSQNSGIESVPTGAGGVTINHGLYTTPQGVVATVFNNTTDIATAFAFTPTQITLSHSAGTTQSVSWTAWVAEANA